MTNHKTLLCSIVIITHERPQEVVNCLNSLKKAQKFFSLPSEIIVVDSSTKNIPQYPVDINFKLIKKPGLKSAAVKRNLGAKNAHGQWLIFIDDDCVVPQNVFKLLQSPLLSADSKTAGFFGITKFIGRNTYAFRACESSIFTDNFCVAAHDQPMFWGATSLAVFRKKAFDFIGGFRQDLSTVVSAEDVDLGIRFTKAGWILRSIPQTLVYHDTSTWSTFAQNFKRFARYGKSEIDLDNFFPEHLRLRLNPHILWLIAFILFLLIGPLDFLSIFFKTIIFLFLTSLPLALYSSHHRSMRLDLSFIQVAYLRVYDFCTSIEAVRRHNFKSLFYIFSYQKNNKKLHFIPSEFIDFIGILFMFLIIGYLRCKITYR